MWQATSRSVPATWNNMYVHSCNRATIEFSHNRRPNLHGRAHAATATSKINHNKNTLHLHEAVRVL